MPTKIHKTNYSGNELASQYQRILGDCCYYSDLDCIASEDGSKEDMTVSYTYKDNKPKPVFIIDWKHPKDIVHLEYSAIKLQSVMADTCKIPFFIGVTYLDEQHPVKCYYIYPENSFAKNYFNKCNLLPGGAWFSLRSFSKFQHALRNKQWNPNQAITKANSIVVGLDAKTLGELPNKCQTYTLPRFQQ